MEDFVTFEMAKKLKTKGFSCQYPFAMYNEKGVFHECYTSVGNMQYYDYDDFYEHDYIAPTISQVLKWLRTEHHIHVSARPHYFVGTLLGWDVDIISWDDNVKSAMGVSGRHKKYEEAALAGIEYTLDNLN